ncbi:MAG: CDP-glucose 4,6-dehydratase [Gemmatimonadota bacterium]|nr:CDP-glucose 4,6-dehydratase [Gemmatimonadota bacterium]
MEVTVFSGAYAGRTVLVTGHTGFKGAWLSIWLQRLGARVVGYALQPPTTPSVFGSAGLTERMEHVEGDVRDTEALAVLVRRHRPDFVFHLAAQPLVRESYVAPAETFEVNMMGTIAVLEAVRRAGHRCTVVMVSTDKCYENREWEHGYRENDPLGGHDPYSASKAAMEIVVSSYRNSFFPASAEGEHGVRVASARAGNVIGGGDWSKDRILPDAIRALAEGRPIPVRNPLSIRPWQHVLEPLSGYLWLGARVAAEGGEALAEGWNFGPLPSETPTVGDLADAVVEAWGGGSWTSAASAGAPHEAGLLRLSIDKANLRLGWKPVWDFSTTVATTVSWYRRFLAAPEDREGVFRACLDDIAAYEAAAREKGLAWTS